jgi:hypothetical protein
LVRVTNSNQWSLGAQPVVRIARFSSNAMLPAVLARVQVLWSVKPFPVD